MTNTGYCVNICVTLRYVKTRSVYITFYSILELLQLVSFELELEHEYDGQCGYRKNNDKLWIVTSYIITTSSPWRCLLVDDSGKVHGNQYLN